MNGSYTPWTLPVGGEEAREVSPRSLAEALLVMTNLTVSSVRILLSILFLAACAGVCNPCKLCFNV